MPSPKRHAVLSKKRTGKDFIELHKWMDEEYCNKEIKPKRHEITNILENAKIVKEKFGNESIKEFLHHIKEDYEENLGYKTIKKISAAKRLVFMPISLLKRKTMG